MNHWLTILLVAGLSSCQSGPRIQLSRTGASRTGSGFYREATALGWNARDSLALDYVKAGQVPGFLLRFKPVTLEAYDSSSGTRLRARAWVSPDYFSLGTDADWARVPLRPQTAQQVADQLGCFLPTRRLVDAIYAAASVKLPPVPLFAFRDSTPVFWHHHLIIEGQRKGRSGLIAGIKKDVVISGRVPRDPKPHRVAIYGWHLPDGRPIQPLYTGHVDWYVDYSHGIRLVYRKLQVEGRWRDYTELLQDPRWRRVIGEEGDQDFLRY